VLKSVSAESIIYKYINGQTRLLMAFI